MMHTHCFRFVFKRPSIARLGVHTVRLYSAAVSPVTPTPGTKTSDPLRILFCGSDLFSISSLNSLNKERERNPQLIESIDVLIRPGKPAGTKLKEIREVPLKAAALELGLKVHERDTFRGWDVPPAEGGPINLIVAVSFGLFVPPRVLNGAKYGGLNVHPSLLPNYRGPAPLHHIIMRGDKNMGVTLQTLDDKAFDHGRILAQQEMPVPFDGAPTFEQLLSFVRPVAADLLTQGIRDRVFVPPFPQIEVKQPPELIHAGKTTTEDRKALWGHVSSVELERQSRALGRLWAELHVDELNPAKTTRVTFEDFELVSTPPQLAQWVEQAAATDILEPVPQDADGNVRFFVHKGPYTVSPQPFVVAEDGKAIILADKDAQGLSVRVKKITVAGLARQPAAKALRALDCTGKWAILRTPDKLIARPMGGDQSRHGLFGDEELTRLLQENPAADNFFPIEHRPEHDIEDPRDRRLDQAESACGDPPSTVVDSDGEMDTPQQNLQDDDAPPVKEAGSSEPHGVKGKEVNNHGLLIRRLEANLSDLPRTRGRTKNARPRLVKRIMARGKTFRKIMSGDKA